MKFKLPTVQEFQMDCLNNSLKNLAIKRDIEPFIGRDKILSNINNHFSKIFTNQYNNNNNNNQKLSSEINAPRNPVMFLHGPPGSLYILISV